MSRLLSLTTLALGYLAVACSDRPEPTGVGEPASSSLTSSEGPNSGRSSGHASVQGTPVQNVSEERYSFTAVSTDVLPLAKGQVEVHLVRFTGEETIVHADVTCLSIRGNEAWVGSRVTRFTVDGQEVLEGLGRPMIFRVLDSGEGNETADLASLVFFAPPGGDLAHCSARPEFPILRQSTIGNIQVEAK